MMAADDGGYTLYIGAPSSDQMGRLYNKAAESKAEEYENCWRWEVQLRNREATRAAVYLAEECRDVRQGVLATVSDWFTRRGCAPSFAAGEIVACDFTEPAPKSDAQRSLQWLQTQVRPTVARLVQEGYTTQTLHALGLAQSETELIDGAGI